jgi:hypothetical protein
VFGSKQSGAARSLPAAGGGTEGAEPSKGGQKSWNEGPKGPNKEGRSNADQEVDLEGLYSIEGKGKVKAPTEAPELLAAAAGPSTREKGAEHFGSQEQPFEWGNEQIWPGLMGTERAAVVELLEEYGGIFVWSTYDLRDTAVEGVEFEVDFTDDKVIFAPRRRVSLYEYDLLKAYCEDRVATGLICKLKLPPGVKHPFVTQTILPRKKDAEGNWMERRVCGDYRPHSGKTVPDKYPMPIADEMFDDLGGSNCFSMLDLRMGYHQIRIR